MLDPTNVKFLWNAKAEAAHFTGIIVLVSAQPTMSMCYHNVSEKYNTPVQIISPVSCTQHNNSFILLKAATDSDVILLLLWSISTSNSRKGS